MLKSITNTPDFNLLLAICTNDNEGLLWLEVSWTERNNPIRHTKDFAGNEYGKAIAYHDKMEAELHERYKKVTV